MSQPFLALPRTPRSHFSLCFFAATSRVLSTAAARASSWQSVVERFPFVEGYARELQAHGAGVPESRERPEWWSRAIADWEARIPGFLPIRAVRESAGLEQDAMGLVFAAGLLEEEPRFGALFEAMTGREGEVRPTVGLLAECWAGHRDREDTRDALHRLQQIGLLQAINPDTSGSHWAGLEVPTVVWDALRGIARDEPTTWARFTPITALPAFDDLILPDTLRGRLRHVPALLSDGHSRTIVIRGPQHNGRRTVLGAVARALGRGVLAAAGWQAPDDPRWRQLTILAVARNALPVVSFDLAPSETVELPCPLANGTALGVTLGRQGGVRGPGAERAVVLTLALPDIEARRQHWRCGAGGLPLVDPDGIAERHRMTGGNIRRAAGVARACAALAGRSAITPADVREGARALNRELLDTLAVPVAAAGDWSHVAAREETLRELLDLELRCRQRERLPALMPPVAGLHSNAGVRALFRGPSGTGKTLAARALAAVLQMDLYRLDLSSVVNKYIGETEKNLDRVFSRAEELDVVLLLDEGDALLTRRTSVQSSNDRYANLETNYLLQRLESFEGILIVTTNAGERIDSAFERRMDVVVDFRQADIPERWDIWRLHLPEPNEVDPEFLGDVARRCVLSGGQIRNAVVHACLLALQGGGLVTAELIEVAVRREYRMAGGVCPLRTAATAVGTPG